MSRLGRSAIQAVHARKAVAVDGIDLIARNAEGPVALGLTGGIHAAIRAKAQNVLNGQNGEIRHGAQEGADDGIVAFGTVPILVGKAAVMYGCESWTMKKAECRRIDAFELWYWRRSLQGDPTSPF